MGSNSIIFVEDSPESIRGTIASIKYNYPTVNVLVIQKLSEFMDMLSTLEANPPILFVIDYMLPTEAETSTPEFDPMHAGKRCLDLLKNSPSLKKVPVVIFTSAPQLALPNLEQGVQIFSKLEHKAFMEFVRNYVSMKKIPHAENRQMRDWLEQHWQWVIGTVLALIAIIISLF